MWVNNQALNSLNSVGADQLVFNCYNSEFGTLFLPDELE